MLVSAVLQWPYLSINPPEVYFSETSFAHVDFRFDVFFLDASPFFNAVVHQQATRWR